MIPLLSALPWRLIGAGAAVVAVLSGAWHYGHTRYEAGEAAVQARWDAERLIAAEAFAKQAAAVAATVEADKAISAKVQHELETRLADSDARTGDLARRLQNSRICPGGGSLSSTSAAAGTVQDGRESGGAGEVGRLADAIRDAESDALVACARDGQALSAVAPWYDKVRENRGETR